MPTWATDLVLMFFRGRVRVPLQPSRILGPACAAFALDGNAGEVTFTADDRFALDGTRLVLDHRVNSSERVYYTEQNCFASGHPLV